MLTKEENHSIVNKYPERTRAKLFNFRPFLSAAIFLACGVIFSYFRITEQISFWWIILSLPFVAVKLALARNWKKTLRALLLLAMCFAVGYMAFFLSVNSFLALTVYDGEYTLTGTVVGLTEEGGFKKVILDDLYFHGKATRGQMTVYLEEAFDLLLSDEISLTAVVRTDLSLFNDQLFRSSDIFQSRCYEGSVESAVVIGKKFNLFRSVQNLVRERLYLGMDESSASVMLGVLTGETSGIDWSTLQNVRYGGVAHLFAVSGLHVGAVFALCTFFFTRGKSYKIPKLVRFLVVATALLFYGGVCGFSPSVVRAIVTCLCFYADNLIGLKKDSLETIGKAAIITILLQPVMLLSVSFQLSFLACLGIALLARPFDKGLTVLFLAVGRGVRVLFKRTDEWDSKPLLQRIEYSRRGMPTPIIERMRKSVTSFLATCFAAQVGTLPVQLTAFGYISGAGLLLNCLFVPFITVAFSFMLAFTFLACILPASAAPIILFAPKAVWSLGLLVFYATDFSALAIKGAFPISASLSYATFFLLLTDKVNLSKKLRVALLLLFGALTLFSVIIGNTL